MKKTDIKSLYYITHINNIPSILKKGILSHSLIENLKLDFTPIYDSQIVSNRSKRNTPDGKNLWNFANLYFQPRNPMLYRVIYEKNKNEIAVIALYSKILDDSRTFVSKGNAASNLSEIFPADIGYKKLSKEVINSEWWREEDGSKREIMAELLVPDMVAPEYIHTIYTANHKTAERVKILTGSAKISVIPEPYMFFQPCKQIPVTEKLSLVEGDMFFSQMQTLTISVNVVGVMGKGLASRAKYQFPDVYVFYQDLCRKNILKMGKPYIYKRESLIDNELADNPNTFSNPNSNKWFLLFPTKKHWKERSDISGIEQGLKWIMTSYKKEEVRSLAVPALGCGLGLLEWKDVGPIMCKYLCKMDVFVSIYLPREKNIQDEFLSNKYLLKN